MHPHVEQPGPMSRCDVLNAQYVRWRLRRNFPETGQEEMDRLWDRVEEMGPIRPARGRPFPRNADRSDVRTGIKLAVWSRLKNGSFYGFTERFLQQEVSRHLVDLHDVRREGPRDKAREAAREGVYEETDPDQIIVQSPGESSDEMLMENLRGLVPSLFPNLNRNESYLIGWLLAVGIEVGVKQKAAAWIGKKPAWTTSTLASITKKAKQLLDQKGSK
jgi:hypothetical protein